MQKDFHYYCIAILARAAGFGKSDALNIAYASQYVDDSTESEPIKVGELPFERSVASPRGRHARR